MRKKSKRSKKSNRVSWASGDDLCQVKLFAAEDCPAIVGLKSQDDLQAQTSGTLQTESVGPNDLPPGFGCRTPSNQSGLEPSYVSQIHWKCPSKFVLSHTWQVASGEESEEIKRQNSRELRVLEAVYPRFSAIPSCPSVSPEVEDEHYDDSQTPVVSLIPIEEEEPVETTCDIAVPEPQAERRDFFSQCNSTVSDTPSSVGADVAVATSVALAEAIMTSNEKGSLIDTDLLIKILGDRHMIQRLMVDSTTTTSTVSEPRTVNPSFPVSVPSLTNPRPIIQESLRTTVQAVPFRQVVRPPVSMPCPDPFRMPNQVRPNMDSVSVNVRPPVMTIREPVQPVKDLNYYKNLIRQHGEEREENNDSIHPQNGQKNYYHHYESKPAHNFNPGELKSKITKPCVFFNTPRGCLKGANCPFQHGVPVQWRAGKVMENQSAKRMKLSGEINGGMLV